MGTLWLLEVAPFADNPFRDEAVRRFVPVDRFRFATVP